MFLNIPRRFDASLCMFGCRPFSSVMVLLLMLSRCVFVVCSVQFVDQLIQISGYTCFECVVSLVPSRSKWCRLWRRVWFQRAFASYTCNLNVCHAFSSYMRFKCVIMQMRLLANTSFRKCVFSQGRLSLGMRQVSPALGYPKIVSVKDVMKACLCYPYVQKRLWPCRWSNTVLILWLTVSGKGFSLSGVIR